MGGVATDVGGEEGMIGGAAIIVLLAAQRDREERLQRALAAGKCQCLHARHWLPCAVVIAQPWRWAARLFRLEPLLCSCTYWNRSWPVPECRR